MAKYQSYAEKLKDPRWQRKRLEIMERDDFQCRSCRSTSKTLNVHHKLYRKGKMPWDYEDEVFLTLCETCHEKAEKNRDAILMHLGQDFRDRGILAIAKSMSVDSGKSTFWGWVAQSIADCIYFTNFEDDQSETEQEREMKREVVIDSFKTSFIEAVTNLATAYEHGLKEVEQRS